MRLVYVDTGAFIALIWRRDQHHAALRDHFRSLRAEGAVLVTSDPVVGETATRLRSDAGLPAAQSFSAILASAAAAGSLRIRDSDPDLRREAFAWMDRYDGLHLSYADCVGAAVATEQRVDAVLGLDADFRVMGFALEP